MDLNQVTLEAANFDQSLNFYQKIGLKLIVLSEGRYARFELPSGSSTLSIHRADQPVIGNTVLYFEVDDVDQRYLELSELGIEFETPRPMKIGDGKRNGFAIRQEINFACCTLDWIAVFRLGD